MLLLLFFFSGQHGSQLHMGQYVSELHMYHFIFFYFFFCAYTFSTCSFVVFTSAAVAHGIIVLSKKIDILFYEHHVQTHGIISYINKERVYFLQLHTYKFGLV